MQIPKIFKLCFFLFLSSCFLRGNHFSQSQNFFNKGFCEKSYHSFYKINKKTKKHKKFAYEAAQSCLKKYKQANISLLFYELIYNESFKQDKFLNFKEKKELENLMAELSFSYLKDYNRAIKYYKEALKFVPAPKKKNSIQYHIAESFFYLKKYKQSAQEIESILNQDLPLKEKKKYFILKGSLLIAQKKFDEGLKFFQSLIKKYPKKESFFREYLALIYEERGDFLLAIKEIEKIEPATPFATKKIKQLYDRLKNQPGENQ